MADDEDDGAAPHATSLSASAAAAAAVAAGSASREKADAYLDRQSALIDLQIEQVRLQNENLRQQDRYERSHLRWRRFSEQMKGALQILIVGLGALIVIGIALLVWNASRADGTVVEAFSVPPSFIQDGMGGDVLASDMTNKLSAIRDVAEGNSLSRSRGVRRESADEIKVEIPDTGISLGEAGRYLRRWLGSESRLSGNLRIVGENRIALSVTVDGQTQTWTGPRGDLDRMEQKAAEWAFGTVDPANIVLYLSAEKRKGEALAAAARFAHLPSNTQLLRSDGFSLWGNTTRFVTGDLPLSLARQEISTAIDSKTVAPHMEMLTIARYLGHDQEVLRQARIIPGKLLEDETPEFQKFAFPYAQELGRFALDTELGDFTQAAQEACDHACTQASAFSHHAEYLARLHDPVEAKSLLDVAQAMDSAPDPQISRTRYFIAATRSDWPAAILAARAYQANTSASQPNPPLGLIQIKTQVRPLLAMALARSGDLNAARVAIAASPADCYDCLRARGQIDALARNWNGAVYWFAGAVHAAPSIPFAYADWGEMLLRKGDLEGAIAKLQAANKIGPHFADPLQMWGEALIRKNRSDLALAKFEDVAKYAPNWGRLHLKWGEALLWSGDHAGAQKQFAIAAHLELTPSEKAELARMETVHGR